VVPPAPVAMRSAHTARAKGPAISPPHVQGGALEKGSPRVVAAGRLQGR
jgi:hypothetical protein